MTQDEFNSTEIVLRVPLASVNVIMTALSERPYVQVADIIQAIREQVIPQVPAPAAQATPKDATVQ